MTEDPTPLDDIVNNSRIRLDRLRRLFPDPADFDHYVKQAIRMTLKEKGFNEKTIRFTLRATFGEGAH